MARHSGYTKDKNGLPRHNLVRENKANKMSSSGGYFALLNFLGGIVVAASVIVAPIGLAYSSGHSSCSKKEPHVHEYVLDGEMVKYLPSEAKTAGDYAWTESYQSVSEEEKELRKFENENGLFRIKENKSFVGDMIRKNSTPKQEYRFAFMYTYRVLPSAAIREKIGFAWTEDSEHSFLTGEEREVRGWFKACKIEIQSDGNRVVIESDYVDDLTKLPEEYCYVKADFYKLFDDNGKEANYEDEARLKTRVFDPDDSQVASIEHSIKVESPKLLVLK